MADNEKQAAELQTRMRAFEVGVAQAAQTAGVTYGDMAKKAGVKTEELGSFALDQAMKAAEQADAKGALPK